MNISNRHIISRYRTELMGIAIIWIFLFHSQFNPPDLWYFYPLIILKKTGYGGVDIFLFLSGFGLMHSMLRNQYRSGSFYVKRFFRIIPGYWITVFLVFISSRLYGETMSGPAFLTNLLTLQFWVGNGLFLWFIPALIAMYLLFPLFYQIYMRAQNKQIAIALVVAGVLSIYPLLLLIKLNHLIIFTARIPIFFIGAHISFVSDGKGGGAVEKIIHYRYVKNFICLIFGIVTGVIITKNVTFLDNIRYGLLWYPFLFATYPLCLFLSVALDKLKHYAGKAFIYRQFQWFLLFSGTNSLEIYLLHENLVFKYGEWLRSLLFPGGGPTKTQLLEYLIYFIVTILLSEPLYRASRRIDVSRLLVGSRAL